MDAAHRAIAWMLLASLAFGTGSALVKWTAGHAGVATVIFGRSLVITLALLAWSRLRDVSLQVGNHRRMLWRCVAGLSAMACYFYAVQQIPLSNAVTPASAEISIRVNNSAPAPADKHNARRVKDSIIVGVDGEIL